MPTGAQVDAALGGSQAPATKRRAQQQSYGMRNPANYAANTAHTRRGQVACQSANKPPLRYGNSKFTACCPTTGANGSSTTYKRN